MDKMLWTKWYMDKMVYGRNDVGQNGMDKMVWINGTDKMVAISCIDFNSFRLQ